MRLAARVVCGALLAFGFSLARADDIALYKAEIGYNSLITRLASESQPLPTGAGVSVMQVEAPMSSTKYLPDTSSGELLGEPVTAKNGTGGGPSSHATTVGRNFYGNTSSIAPQIASVAAYNANDYLNNSYLRVLAATGPYVDPNPPKVQNFSFIVYSFTSSPPYSAADIGNDLLRRFDYVIKRDNSIAVVAVGNSTAMPQALAGSYNSIAVGMSDATSSIGPTTIDGAGRSKPDIVAPGKFPYATPSSSYAAPKVSAAAALLVETGNNLTSNSTDAVMAETIKAVLLTGATKDSLPSWSHTDTQPLDHQYGAGLLNVDNSHRILTAGEHEASNSSLVPSTGWDYGAIDAAGTKNYFFDIGSSFALDQLSITATWLRDIAITDGAGIAGSALLTPSLANLDLKLYSATGFTPNSLLAQSVSTVDNVEHIFLKDLPAGRYMISLTSNQAWNFGLAWDAQVSPIPEPSAWVLWLIGVGTLAAIRLRGRKPL